jgi:hypothetical protein
MFADSISLGSPQQTAPKLPKLVAAFCLE